MTPDHMSTARELARRTGFSYRTILQACTRGELESFRPSGTGTGTIYITDSAWAAYLDRIRTKTRVPGRISRANPDGRPAEIDKLALS